MTSIALIVIVLLLGWKTQEFPDRHHPSYRSFPLPISEGMFRNCEERLLTQSLNPEE